MRGTIRTHVFPGKFLEVGKIEIEESPEEIVLVEVDG